MGMADSRLQVWVQGRVQGVGFRDWARSRARQLGLRGSAENLPDGRVEIVLEGPRAGCQVMLDELVEAAGPGHVSDVEHSWEQPRGEDGFRVG